MANSIKLAQCFTFCPTCTYSRAELEGPGELKVVHYGDIHTSLAGRMLTDRSILPGVKLEKQRFTTGPLLIVADASEDLAGVGLAVAIPSGFGPVVGGTHTHALFPDSELVDESYLPYVLAGSGIRSKIEKAAQGAKVSGLSKSSLANLPLRLPPLPTQRRIAAILQTWDRAITLAEQQLADLQERKRGLMQLLLTGKDRLPGFEGAWKEVRLGEVSMFLSSNSLSRNQLTDDPTSTGPFVIHYGDLHSAASETIVADLSSYFTRVSEPFEASGTELRIGDMVISDASEDELGIGMSIELGDIRSQTVLPGLHTIALRPKANVFASGFLGYRLSETSVRNIMRRVSQGASVKGLSKTEVAKLSFAVPSVSEQSAIVSVMKDVDQMSDKTLSQVTRFQLQKKGLMQRLLEGDMKLGKEVEKF